VEHGLLHEIKQHPKAMWISIALHLLLLIIVTVSFNDSSAPQLPKVAKVKTVQAVVVDARVVDAELNKLKKAQQNERNKEVNRKKRLQKEAKKAKDARRKEEKRLANLKLKQKKKDRETKAKQAKLEKERKKKQQELAKLEKKRQAEQQKLAAIESKRKAEEEAERKKQQAKQAEIRRQQELVELKRQMEEDEREQAKLNSRLQKLRAQYVKLIEQKIERNWTPPASMTKGWSCVVNVQQNVLGDVTDVRMVNCSGSGAFKDTVERAVRKASPLPAPPDPKVFEKKVRITFRPNV